MHYCFPVTIGKVHEKAQQYAEAIQDCDVIISVSPKFNKTRLTKKATVRKAELQRKLAKQTKKPKAQKISRKQFKAMVKKVQTVGKHGLKRLKEEDFDEAQADFDAMVKQVMEFSKLYQ